MSFNHGDITLNLIPHLRGPFSDIFRNIFYFKHNAVYWKKIAKKEIKNFLNYLHWILKRCILFFHKEIVLRFYANLLSKQEAQHI